ncbi:MAG: response regulator [Mariniblastus sp.]
MPKPNPVVVVVEDDIVDLEALLRGIKKRNLQYEIHHKQSAESAIASLEGDGFSPEQRENLIVILDINMPSMNGHQFLESIRNSVTLRRTIIFVLTTSNDVNDKAKAYDKNIAGYFVKSNVSGLLDTVALYLENVEFPPFE